MLTMREISCVRSPHYLIVCLMITWASTSPFAHIYSVTERFKRRKMYESNHTTLVKKGAGHKTPSTR